jgi:hypothetical protein
MADSDEENVESGVHVGEKTIRWFASMDLTYHSSRTELLLISSGVRVSLANSDFD